MCTMRPRAGHDHGPLLQRPKAQCTRQAPKPGVRMTRFVLLLIPLLAWDGDAVDSPAYNETEALLHVYYSKAAFCTEHAITSWSCGEMCSKAPVVKGAVRYIPEGKSYGVQGYVARTQDDRCIVAFRGLAQREKLVC